MASGHNGGRDRVISEQAEKTREEIRRLHKNDLIFAGLLVVLIALTAVNLVTMKRLYNSEKVEVVIPQTAAPAASQSVTAAAPAADRAVTAAASDPPGDTALVNINTAGIEELKTLPGIGDARAADIIAWRDLNGAFPTVGSITEVPGIGDAIFEQIRDMITV